MCISDSTYTDPSTGETVKEEAASLSTPQSILGKCIIFLDRYTGKERTFKIVGVAETNLDTSKYSKYMPGAKRQNSDIMDIFTLQEMKTKLKYSYHSLCFVYPGVINEIYSSNVSKMCIRDRCSRSQAAFRYKWCRKAFRYRS